MYCIDICIMYKCIIYAITHLSPTYPILCKCSRASRKEDMDKTNKIYFDKMDNSMENFLFDMMMAKCININVIFIQFDDVMLF